MRLIDADTLDEAFTRLRFDDKGEMQHWGDRKDWCLFGHEIEKLIADAPTIDAEPVRRGRWIYNEEENTHHCSRCNALVEVVSSDEWDYRYWRYCPNCGAKMEEQE